MLELFDCCSQYLILAVIITCVRYHISYFKDIYAMHIYLYLRYYIYFIYILLNE